MENSTAAKNKSIGLITSRNTRFLLFNIIAIIIFYKPLRDVFLLSFQLDETYSHLMIIPIVSGYFIYSERKRIFSYAGYSFVPGSFLIIAGLVSYLSGRASHDILNQNDYLSAATFSAVLFWIGGFILFYGLKAFSNMKFPFLFMVFMIPIPSVIIDNLVSFFQKYSAEAAYGIFNMLGVSFVREGMTFHFSKVSVEVAPQCSGIRSSIALFITSIIAGHLFLKTTSRKTVLSLAIIPVTILKNALRIVTITLLAINVDMSFLTNSWLHKEGGIVFFLIALLILLPVLLALRKSEKKVFEKL